MRGWWVRQGLELEWVGLPGMRWWPHWCSPLLSDVVGLVELGHVCSCWGWFGVVEVVLFWATITPPWLAQVWAFAGGRQ